MALIFEQIHTPGIAQLSYLLGDDAKGIACAIDPRRDVHCYLELSRKNALSITHVYETHIHADFLSGGSELKRRLPSTKIFCSHEGGASYGFDHENLQGPPTFGNLSPVPALTAGSFKEAIAQRGTVLVDTRSMLGFGGGHIKGALNIGARAELSPWAGWMLKFDDLILPVIEKDEQLDEVIPYLWRVCTTRCAGYLAGGMKAWDNAGVELKPIPQITVHDVKNARHGMQILDVRSKDEWKSRHIPDAKHFFVPDVRENIDQFDKTKPIATCCGSGHRASLAASILKQEGSQSVYNIAGSWQAWKKAGYPIEGEINQ